MPRFIADPRPVCPAVALLCLFVVVAAGCGPKASPPPATTTTAPPLAELGEDGSDRQPNPESDRVVPDEPDPESAAPGDEDVPPPPEEDVLPPPSEPSEVSDHEPQVQPDQVTEQSPDQEPVDATDGEEPSLSVPEQPYEPPEPEPARDLGPPLVDDIESLKRLDPDKPLWLDAKNHRVVMVGQVCLRDGPLEMFACLRETKEHESIVTVDVVASQVHAGLLVVGAKVGHPVQFDPVYAPAQGTVIEVTLVWKDEKGEQKTAPAQQWILDAETNKPMTQPWVFAGSGFWVDERTGKNHYMADGGDFICVSNFPTAMLDLPIESSQANNALIYRALTDAIPPLGTPVTLILTPKIEDAKPQNADPENSVSESESPD